ncbi:MAG: DNA mismatch repair endonuclease MutL [Oscillospiraceae bacterium]|nr:DNA mismatch repair endonuclease MutL [Oscillospiraceae bacterium]
MPEINILSPHVADMIAAGEVVERPASVIKELMENSFDAGAHSVTVEIRDGGATYIRVQDDGKGMAPEDAGIAFMRHATSKLHDETGLEAIGTMGFRGEALAAISAVSEVELLTRRHGDESGTRVTLNAGDIQDMGETGCPEGTVMQVRSLFFNTPARLKFLKSDRAEASACVQTALRCALGRPEVSVRLLRDGKEEFFSPGDGKALSCVYALLGRDTAKDFLPIELNDGDMSVTGFVSSPSAGRGNRGMQFFYCNGRFIRSLLLQTAVEQAYKNTLLTGRFPACVIYLKLSNAAVDVNVHPAKTEVKFSQEKRVFDLVYHAVLASLSQEDRTTAAEEEKPKSAPAYTAPAAKPNPRPDFYRSMSAADFRAQNYSVKPAAPSRPAEAAPVLRAFEQPYQTHLDMTPAPMPAVKTQESTKRAAMEPVISGKTVENSVQSVEKPALPEYKLIGEALHLYILVETGDELMLIDKHAAHERMIFDRLKMQDRSIMAQTLLEGVTLRLDGEERELLEQNGELLSELGFEIEQYGEDDFILRTVPADMNPSDARAAVEEIFEKLRGGKAPDPKSARDEILHTVACKAAIKAGYITDRQELDRIVRAVLSGAVKYCPHGRPVSAVLGRRDLDKLFKRIV